MLKYIREYRFYIILFFFLLIPVIAIDTSTRAPRDFRFYDRVIVILTSPIQTAISWTLDKGVSLFQNYIYLLTTRKENIQLIDENRKLLNKIASLNEIQKENLRLRKLLDFQETNHLTTVLARVIAMDVSTEFRAIRINRGENAGIRKDMAVVTNDGVVGRVLRTAPTSSDVVMVLDPLSAVDAIVERSRARGIVVGGVSEDIALLKFALRTDDIQPGDLLVSSGLEGIFPKGVPVGSVTEVDRRPFGITQQVKVRPSVDFSKLEEVLVVTRADIQPLALSTNSAAPVVAGTREPSR